MPRDGRNPPYRGRFAPSPTGPLHMGSVLAALGSWLMARRQAGEWLVRMEDVDRPREVRGSAIAQIQALQALGLESDCAIVRQSGRGEHYARALERMVEQGLAFRCWCSRSDLAASGGVHLACVAPPADTAPAFRLRVPERVVAFEDRVRGHCSQSLRSEVGDFALRRADGCWTYQLAVVVDDALQGITEVVRGADLLDSTPRQIHLQQVLGYPTPAYAHLPLVRQPDGSKLGKSLASAPFDPAQPVAALRLAFGWLGQEVRAIDGAGGASAALERALASFDPSRIPSRDHVLQGP